MNPVEIVALDALDLLVVVDNESDTLSSVDKGVPQLPELGPPVAVKSAWVASPWACRRLQAERTSLRVQDDGHLSDYSRDTIHLFCPLSKFAQDVGIDKADENCGYRRGRRRRRADTLFS